MALEHIKSIFLILLITSSLLLTFALWSDQPNYEVHREEEDLIEAELTGGTRLSKREVLAPKQIIKHASSNDQPVGLDTVESREQFKAAFYELSLYNFSILNFSNRWYYDLEDYLEISFNTALPSPVIYDLFAVDQDTYIPDHTFDRMLLIRTHDIYQVLFVSDTDSAVVVANVQNFSRAYEGLNRVFTMNEEELQTYTVFTGTRGVQIYLPEQQRRQTLLYSYTDLEHEAFINLLFSNPQIVRSSYTIGGDTTFIDGTREMVVDSKRIRFTNPTNEQREADRLLTSYQLFDQVQSFINAHLGFTIEEPFSYMVSQIEQTSLSSEVRYSLRHESTPIYFDRDLAEISVRWHNQGVYQYVHPLVMLLDQRGVGQTASNLPRTEDVINILEGPNYQGTAIYDVVLGYRFTEQMGGQGQVYSLTPTWYVRGVHGYNPLIIPASDEAEGGGGYAVGAD